MSRYIASIRLEMLPPSQVIPNGSITAYALLDDGWHWKTFHATPEVVVKQMMDGFNGHYGDNPEVWPLGGPD